MQHQELLPVVIKGHLYIEDDLGNVLVDKDNAIHPQNMARVISRALANENNYFIKRIAFGNGGTDVDAALNISFNPPNDGQTPDTRTWDSRLYNETYSEIVDDSDVLIGSGPGANPAGDPPTIEHVSGPGTFSKEQGILSQVIVRATLNKDEPSGQLSSGTSPESTNFDSSFTFDEIGLFTVGKSQQATAGYQDVRVGVPADITSESDTGITGGSPQLSYGFEITVDGGTPVTITFTPPTGGSGNGTDAPLGAVTFGDLCEAINTGDVAWNPAWGSSNPLPGNSNVSITDFSGNYPSIAGDQTFGFLRFTSGGTPGASSSIVLEPLGTNNVAPPGVVDLFAAGLNPPGFVNYGTDITTVDGEDAGVQNDPVNSVDEAERLLTHVIFAPVLKSSDRALNIIYTLTVAVARTT